MQAPELFAVREKVLVDADSPIRISVKFDHPSVEAIGLELIVPGSVEKVC